MYTNLLTSQGSIFRILRVFRAFSNVSAFSTKVENADMNKNFLFVSAVRSPLSAVRLSAFST